jgi:hypothetical protein
MKDKTSKENNETRDKKKIGNNVNKFNMKMKGYSRKTSKIC